jgi:hypothetical protein
MTRQQRADFAREVCRLLRMNVSSPAIAKRLKVHVHRVDHITMCLFYTGVDITPAARNQGELLEVAA